MPAHQNSISLTFGEARLDALQRHSFAHFLRETNPANGLVADRSEPGSPASIAAVGFALAAYPVGVERGWMARADARARTFSLLRFFWASPQGTASPHHFGINLGPVVLMFENHRSDLLWRLMRTCPYVVAGLRRARFTGGWL